MNSEARSEFQKELEHLINKYSKENGSNTPDFILARYLVACLSAFDVTTNQREQWYGRPIAGEHKAVEPRNEEANDEA